tara:strand:- start:374 stop:1693 length:1320 start_codon:yes stop_codon:yes gene_type:complete
MKKNNSKRGQKLWLKAKKIIPGGNMLLSKRSEMFLPDKWPSYFSKSKGCHVWDLDKNKFIDFSLMGVGTNILGYANNKVDLAVKKTINNGNMSTLNCPEEVELAEKLVSIHPWAEMVRLARTGGEANSIAIRIARASSGKDKVAICGYHGWHDWYLSTNIGKKNNLDDHLLPGLNPKGVPNKLKGLTIPFKYNSLESFFSAIDNKDIGVIKMEVTRSVPPEPGFLETIRKVSREKNIVLIFDECTSGFRETYGGIHKKYNIDPDIAVFGKALGNGYAISAIIGRREIMESCQDTFVSSTFWTERIGPTAALETLKEMQRLKSWNRISATGRYVKEVWQRLSDKYELKLNISGIDAIPKFSFNSKNNLAYKTFITQEMLKRGFLSSNSVYTCINHSKKIINEYERNIEKIFKTIKECESNININDLLDSKVCHSDFQRLN